MEPEMEWKDYYFLWQEQNIYENKSQITVSFAAANHNLYTGVHLIMWKYNTDTLKQDTRDYRRQPTVRSNDKI